MAGTADTGVKGFFSDYGKQGRRPRALPVTVEQRKEKAAKDVNRDRKQGTVTKEKARARTGRPPGIRNGSRAHNEKVTVHINSELMDFYRNLSWEVRCNLGELIERAMVAYKQNRR